MEQIQSEKNEYNKERKHPLLMDAFDGEKDNGFIADDAAL